MSWISTSESGCVGVNVMEFARVGVSASGVEWAAYGRAS